MASLHFVDDFRELLAEPPGQDPYDYPTMLPAGTRRERHRSRRTLTLLRKIDHPLRAMLEDGEWVRFLTQGSMVTLWESFFLGAMMYYVGRRAVVLTNRRMLLLQISARGELRNLRAQIDYRAVREIRTTIFGNLKIWFVDGTVRVLQGVPRAQRKAVAELVPVLRDEQPADDEPVVDDVEDLCPHCAQPPGGAGDHCQVCGGYFKSASHAALLSGLFPGTGDLYLGHKVLGSIGIVVASLLWLGVLILGLEATGTPPVFARAVGMVLVLVHGGSAASTRWIALKGLYPADEPGGRLRRVALAAVVPVIVLAVTAGPVIGRRGLAPTGRVVMGDSLPAHQLRRLREAGYLGPDEQLVRFYAPGSSVLAEGLVLTDHRVGAYSALAPNRFSEVMEYDEIIDIARQPAPGVPGHTMLFVAKEGEGGFWFPLPSVDAQDSAFEADLVARWRARRLTRSGGVWFDGGAGESATDAVLIRGLAPSTSPEMAERYWLRVWYGAEGQGWRWIDRTELDAAGGQIERVTIEQYGGVRLARYFAVAERASE